MPEHLIDLFSLDLCGLPNRTLIGNNRCDFEPSFLENWWEGKSVYKPTIVHPHAAKKREDIAYIVRGP